MNRILRSAVLLALAASHGHAIAEEDELTQLRHRVEQLERLVKDLTAAQESRTASPLPVPSGAAPTTSAASGPAGPAGGAAGPTGPNSPGSGANVVVTNVAPSTNGADVGLKVQVHGDLQADARFYEGGRLPAAGSTRGTADTFLLRRARPIIEATALDWIDFRVMPDFGGGNTTLYDAYAEARFAPEFRLRAGKFKAPVGLEALQVDDVMMFSERSLANNLFSIRDVGVQLAGDLAGGTVQYATGVFNGAVDATAGGDRATDSGKEFDTRLFFRPFRNGNGPLKGLGAGVSYTYGRPVGNSTTSLLPTYLSSGQQPIYAFSTGAYADGPKHRLSPQAYYYVGPFGAMVEYVDSRYAVTRATNHRELGNRGWETTASYVLTGEDVTYEGVKPQHPAWHGGYGALQVAARAAKLKLDTAAFAGSATTRLADPTAYAYEIEDYGLELNWYLTQLIRFNLSYDKNTFKGLAAFTKPDERVFIGRFQVSF
jgi:phosphate-selective porin OprO and OprP